MLYRINKFGPAIVRTGINSKALKDSKSFYFLNLCTV